MKTETIWMLMRSGPVLALLLATLGCAMGAGPEIQQWSAANGGPDQPERRVIRSVDEWQAWWRDRGRDAPRALDPEREMAVVVALGERRTGGYSVTFLSVREDRGQLAVRYKASTPPPGTAVMQMITHPWAAAIIPRSDEPVVFQQLTPGGEQSGARE